MPAGQAASPPTRLGVVGAGTMGSGIALTAARSGIQTILLDASDDALGKGLQRIRKALDTAVEKGGLSMSQRDDAISRIEMTTDFAQLKGCEVVVEAVVEIAKVKDEVFEKIFRAASPDVVLASNTSTLSITKMADSVSRPNNFIALLRASRSHGVGRSDSGFQDK
jgi:3-hydroxyacyl-CoA dehydrogenase/enoyl-CoA hydratase/3-hydroxybutyryl-CoA epimerase